MTEPTGFTAVGMVGFTDKGTYSASASYVKNDLVHYGGNIWRCLIDDTTGITPTEGTNWTLFVGEPTNMAERIIAPLEVSPSENAYSVGEQLIFNDALYKAKTAIAVGDALVVDTNIELAPKVTSQIQTLTNETSDIVNVLGAKNLLPMQSTTQVVNGVTFTVNSDNSVTANGTATADANFNVVYRGTGVKPSGTDFILSGCPSGGSDSTYYIAVTKTVSGSGQNIGSDYGNGLEFTLDSNVSDIGTYIHVANGVTINKTFYPMIRPSSIVDSTYVPYAMTNRELTEEVTQNSSQIQTLNSNLENYIMPTGVLKQLNGIDLDTFFISGKYWCTSRCSNLPISGKQIYLDSFVYSQIDSSGDHYAIQVAYGFNSDKMYKREILGKQWGAWKSITFE